MSLLQELKRRNVIRVGIAYVLLGWVVLQAADFALDLVDAPNWIIQVFFIAGLIGLPFALFFAWAFEVTPEGIKREEDVDRSQSVTPETGRKLDKAIIAFLALALVLVLAERFVGSGQPTAEPTASETPTSQEPDRVTLAVLPFRAMSSGDDDEFFADGLTEELLNALTQVPDLAVTSRTSAFHFKDRDLPIGEIAEQLGVEHVVEGSVRRSGDRLRVTAQLIRTADDTHLWSETFDRDDTDAIAVQEEIAERITETLGVFLDEDILALMRSAGLRDATAFIEYQKGRKLHEDAHDLGVMMPLLAEGNRHLEAALVIQPNFTPAWLFYSDYYTHLLLDHAMGVAGKTLSEEESVAAYASGQEAFKKAARGSNNPNTRTAAELDLAIYEGNSRSWRPLLERMLDVDTCESVIWHQLIGFVPEYASRFAKTMAQLRACDPMTNRYGSMLLSGHLWAGDAEQGLNSPAVGMVDKHAFQIAFESLALIALGRFEEAEMMAAIDSPDDRQRLQLEQLLAAARGDELEARRIDQALQNEGDNRFHALRRAAVLGDRERANELAAQIDAERLGHLSLLMSTYWCACGAPFDLEATPNFARIWNDADFPWPLESPINFPLKDW